MIVKELNLKGADASDFSINEAAPFTIEHDSSKILTINFAPKTTGMKNVDLEIKSNAIPDSLKIIPIVAKKDSVALTTDLTTIDLGYLCPKQTKDTSLVVTNIGTIATVGYATASANLILTNDSFNIERGSNYTIKVHFNGIPNEGKFRESISIADSLCGISNDINIIGEVAFPKIFANRLELTSMKGSYKDDKIIISNPSKRDVTIESVTNLAAPFEIIGNPFPISIAAEAVAELPIRFTPADNHSDTINIVINAQPCSITTSVDLVGLTTLCSATLQILNYEAYPGDIIEVPIILNSAQNLELSGATNLKVDLSYNPTLLLPIGYDKQTINDNLSKITIEHLPINKAMGDTLTRVRFSVGLGNAELCGLDMSNAAVVGGAPVDFSLLNGGFKLLGVCHEGGARLINPNSKAQIMSIRPNPAINVINIEYQLVEKGASEFILVNYLGETVKQISYSEISDFSRRSETIKLDDLSTGQYLFILKTPTYIESWKVMVVK